VSYHQEVKRCSRCDVRCRDVEWRPLLEEHLCFECKSQVQLENLRIAGVIGHIRGWGKGDSRELDEEKGGPRAPSPLPSPDPQLGLFE